MSAKQALERQGFVGVSYPSDLVSIVASAMVSWQQFCQLSRDEKSLFSTGDRLRDYGYMLREDKVGKADPKELFHVNLKDLPHLQQTASTLPKKATCFIDACSDLINGCDWLVCDFARTLEEEFGLVGFEDQVAAAKQNWTFRFLHYCGNEILAHPHVDRGGFTLHLSETCEGVEFLGLDGEWRPLTLSSKETIIFPGMILQHLSKCEVKALWHRVVGRTRQIENDRYAIVAFIDFGHTHRYNDAMYRTQDLPIGSTYNLPFAAIDKLFQSK